MAKKQPQSIAQPAPASKPVPAPLPPEWLCGTPPEDAYELKMWGDDQHLEQIFLERSEYIALKLRLGELRGFTLTPMQIEDLEYPVSYDVRLRLNASAA